MIKYKELLRKLLKEEDSEVEDKSYTVEKWKTLWDEWSSKNLIFWIRTKEHRFSIIRNPFSEECKALVLTLNNGGWSEEIINRELYDELVAIIVQEIKVREEKRNKEFEKYALRKQQLALEELSKLGVYD